MSKPRKAVYCDECRYFDLSFECVDLPPCQQGHRQMFYQPKSERDRDLGWKRRCEDFERVEA